METSLKFIIESLLFVSEKPLGMDQFADILPDYDTKDIKNSLKELSEEYEKRNGAFGLYEVAGGFQIRTKPLYLLALKEV